MTGPRQDIAAVVIGRNEGERLLRCLESLQGQVSSLVYVDSGSTDGSVAAAEAAGAVVVALDMTQPFTAARARNAGLACLDAAGGPDLVQMIDADCILDPDWIGVAAGFLADHPDVVMLSGRLRERFPEATVWNRLADHEWAAPAGETDAVGGIAVLRRGAVAAVGGYRDSLIAGEEPELCLRLRRAGGQIWRLAADMAWHDIAMTRFSQWWRRARRHGHAVAEGAHLHGRGPERYCVLQTRRALLWGLWLPLVALLGLFITPLALLVLLAWPLQVLRIKARGEQWTEAFFLVVGKLPETQGIIRYHLQRMAGKSSQIIEYKTSGN